MILDIQCKHVVREIIPSVRILFALNTNCFGVSIDGEKLDFQVL